MVKEIIFSGDIFPKIHTGYLIQVNVVFDIIYVIINHFLK